MEAGLIIGIVLGSLTVIGSIVAGFWQLWQIGKSIGRLEGEVKTLSKNQESQHKTVNERITGHDDDIRSINLRMNHRVKI